MANGAADENVTVRFPPWILELVDEVCDKTHLSRSDFLRLGALEKLDRMTYLSSAQKKALGINGETK